MSLIKEDRLWGVLNGGLTIPPNNQRSNFKHRVGRPVFVYLEDEKLKKRRNKMSMYYVRCQSFRPLHP